MICIKTDIPAELNEIDDELKATYHSSDTVCFYIFKTVCIGSFFRSATYNDKKNSKKYNIFHMNNDYLNIYNNLIKLTRNKNIYSSLKNNDTFSDRLIIFLFHYGFFLKLYKNDIQKKESQKLFDFVIKQIELSIREIGYGDVSVNKKMKEYVNLFYSILEKIENWENLEKNEKNILIGEYMNIKEDNNIFIDYIDKYRVFLSNNSLKNFTKDILNLKI